MPSLHCSADKLEVTHAPPPPPKLTKLDTTISRYPQALAINHQAQLNRPMAPGKHDPTPPRRSPRPNRKGLIVRFADSYPDIIGEGGDESEVPVIEVRRNKLARKPLPFLHRVPLAPSATPMMPPGAPEPGPVAPEDDVPPRPLVRSQTCYTSVYDPQDDPAPASAPQKPRRDAGTNGSLLLPGRTASARYLETLGRRDENRKYFIELHQAEMREAEGKAFAQAARTATAASQPDWEDSDRPLAAAVDDSPGFQTRRAPVEYSPAASISNASSTYHQSSPSQNSVAAPLASVPSWQADAPPPPGPPLGPPPLAAQMSSVSLRDVVDAAGDDALVTFVTRTTHLFKLFRLHAEAVRPLSTCAPRDCGRSALWWFLKGRMGLELAIRDHPTSPQAQMQNELDRQQAYSNLAKGYWLCEEVIPQIAEAQRLPPDAETTGVVQSLIVALGKLSQSMKRNGFLPLEEPFLPQTIDKSIWLEYPPLSQDMVASPGTGVRD